MTGAAVLSEASAPRGGALAHLRGLKVLFLVNHFPVLSEAFIAYAAVGLIEAGADVRILAVHQPSQAPDRRHARTGLLQRHDLAERVVCPRFATEGRRRLTAAPGAVARLYARFGGAALRLLDRRLSLPFVAEALSGAPDFDIVHCQFSDLTPVALRLRAAGVVSGRVVAHFRGYDISHTRIVSRPRALRTVMQGADRYLANCAHFRDRAVALGCPADRIEVCPSGLDLTAFPFAPRPARSDVLRILCIGRLTAKKGFTDAIDATALLNGQGHPARLTIIGEGQERAALESRIAALGMGHAVTLAGAQDHEAVRQALSGADVFLAPSVTARTGEQDAPVNTLKEAMACGAPVVATRHGGIPELVEDGRTGLLIAERDPAGLAAAVRRLADDPDLGRRLASAARDEIERRWSLTHATDVYAETYAKALAAEPRRRP